MTNPLRRLTQAERNERDSCRGDTTNQDVLISIRARPARRVLAAMEWLVVREPRREAFLMLSLV